MGMTTFNELFLGHQPHEFGYVEKQTTIDLDIFDADIDAPIVIEMVGGGGGGGGAMTRTNTVGGGGGAVGQYVREVIPSLRGLMHSQIFIDNLNAILGYYQNSTPLRFKGVLPGFRSIGYRGSAGIAGTSSATAPTPGGTGGATQVSLQLRGVFEVIASGELLDPMFIGLWQSTVLGGQGGRCALDAQNNLAAFQRGFHRGGLAQLSTVTTAAGGGAGATNDSMGRSARTSAAAATYEFGSLNSLPLIAGANLGGSPASSSGTTVTAYATGSTCILSRARSGNGGSYRTTLATPDILQPGSGGMGGGSAADGSLIPATSGEMGRITIAYRKVQV